MLASAQREMSEREAEAYAMRFLITHFNGQFDESEFKLQERVNGLYVFSISEEGGYVIVSNDDRTTSILGFSENGKFDQENMPDNMRAWLQGYADEIAWLQQHGNIQARPATQANNRSRAHATDDITPMVTARWSQRAPYNDLCPDYSTGQRAVTGCVATAMAQVMDYHKWPTAATTAIPGYEDDYGRDRGSLEATTFDWANMQNSYSGSETSEQNTAVARLMQYCGYSVEMNYGPKSGTSLFKVADALKNYFDYNSTTTYISRSYYSNDRWEDIIYHELASHRPVLYGGLSATSGHAFVCDGYKYEYGTNFFHINWGWGGQSDEYYVLSVLDPYSGQGTGGSSASGGYYFGHEAIIGIQKPYDGGTIADITPAKVNLTPNSMTLSSNAIVVGETVTITINVTNNSSDDFDGDIFIGTTEDLLVADVFSIPAGQTRDCVLTYKPTRAGTYDLLFYEPLENGYYGRKGGVLGTLKVADETPTDLTASEISPTSVTLSWTQAGKASSWVMAYRTASETDFTEIQAGSNPFTLTGLKPETQYAAKVRPVIGEAIKWSSTLSFTTGTLRIAPKNLTISDITATSALVSWEGNASSYDVRYGHVPENSSTDAVWLKYDDENAEISTYGFKLPETTWGVKYPGSMVTGNKLTKIAIYETYLNTESITVNIYSGGDNAPGTLLHTEAVEPITGNAANQLMHEITLTPSVSVTAGESLWITLTEKGSYPIACYESATVNPNNQWLLFNDKWYQMGDLLPGYAFGWIIRGLIDSDHLDAVEWSSPTNCTEPSYSLTSLSAGRDYAVQVRSNYDNQDYSKWETTTFTTLENVDIDGPAAQESENSYVWYSLDGRRLKGKPTAKGLYIRTSIDPSQGKENGRKFVIK